MSEMVKENKMGVQPIKTLIISMSLPIMISMLIQALYNIVDSIFVSKINEEAFTAVSLAFPVQNLMIALAVGTGVGINAFLARSLGEKKFDNANKAARNGLFLALLNYILFVILGLLFSRIYFEMLSSNAKIIDYGVTYMRIITIFSIGCFGQVTCERLLQATGKTVYSMFTQGAGAIINIILDPVLIFGLGPFPRMGIAGAAAATVIGQILSFVFGIFLNVKVNKEININMLGFRPDLKIIKKIYAVGLPAIVMQSITSVMTFGMNKILGVYGDTAQAVMGAYFKLQSFIFMPVFGLNNGLVPIISYNFGARKKKRMSDSIKYGMLYATVIMAVGTLIMQVLPSQLLKMFSASENMMSMGVMALRIISASFIFAGIDIVISSSLQALGYSIFSMFVSIARQLVILLPAAYIIARATHYSNVDYIWTAFIISEVVSLACSVFALKIAYKKVVAPLPE